MEVARFRVLSDEDLSRIHKASLDILSEVGVSIHSDKVLRLLADYDARVDFREKTAKIPGSLIEECISSAPAKITLCNRDKQAVFTLGDGKTRAACGHNATFIRDSETETERKVTKKDVADFVKIADALGNIDIVGIPAMPQDVLPKASLVHAVGAAFNNTTKHIYFSPEGRETKVIYDIAKVITGDENLASQPIITCQLSPTSPLGWEKRVAEALMETASEGVPCCILPDPYSGVSSPITLAGELVIINAEFLSGLVIAQLAKKGAPLIHGVCCTTFDMRQGNVATGSPESCLLRIGEVQLGQFYHLPSHSIAFDSDSPCLDEQNAWERTLSTLAALNSGADVIIDAGMYNAGMVISVEQLVMDDELLGMLRRFRQGIEVSPETLAVDLIKKVGPRGSFLQEEHTLRYLRTSEHWEPEISIRSSYQLWKQKGGLSIVDKARQRVKTILQSHHPQELPSDIQAEIRKIVESFERSAEED